MPLMVSEMGLVNDVRNRIGNGVRSRIDHGDRTSQVR